MKEPHNALKHLTRICLLADLTLMVVWNADEAGKVIETYKMYENKPPDAIMERVEQYPYQKVHFHKIRTVRRDNFNHVTCLPNSWLMRLQI
jgi:DNA excision repair protein ERCC-1